MKNEKDIYNTRLLVYISPHSPIVLTSSDQDKSNNGTAQKISSCGYLMTTNDFAEGTTAFIEKRKAEFFFVE